jgi:hypothetical protein
MHIIKYHPLSNIRKEICTDWRTAVPLYIYIVNNYKFYGYNPQKLQHYGGVGVLFFTS